MKLDKCPYCGNEQDEKFAYCQACSEDMNPSVKKEYPLNSFQKFIQEYPYNSPFLLFVLFFILFLIFQSIYIFILWAISDIILAAYTAKLKGRSMAWALLWPIVGWIIIQELSKKEEKKIKFPKK